MFSTSRFSRTGSTTIIEEVEARGAYVVSATSNYDPRTPVGKYMQLMELANARFQNDENGQLPLKQCKALLKEDGLEKPLEDMTKNDQEGTNYHYQ